MEIRKGTRQDIDEVAALYDELTEYLEGHTNYPGWKKGIYPTREDAVSGTEEENLFVVIEEGCIAGTVVLSHKPEENYKQADWHVDLDYADIFVIHTLAVHPRFLHQGIGRKIMEFIVEYSVRMKRKAIRLDVYEKNTPAIRLYEQFGFQYIDTVDLGYGMHGLDWFKLYQRLL